MAKGRGRYVLLEKLHLSLVVDYFSRYIEIAKTPITTSAGVGLKSMD
jgi:hypothetical protein